MQSETRTTSKQRGRKSASQQDAARLSPETMAIVLHDLDVPFVSIPKGHTPVDMPSPALLLTSLAASDEARLRTALIPLLLRHPAFSRYAQSAANRLDEPERSSFMCYYSAAVLLQRKYHKRLATITDDAESLPAIFSGDLNLPEATEPDEILRVIAARHRAFSGRPLNWLGTYEYAADRWMTHLERRQAWAA